MDPKDFLSEAHIMKKLRHPKLIQVVMSPDYHLVTPGYHLAIT